MGQRRDQTWRCNLAQIIFLHGASSSGKSTIARVLQSVIEKPFWHISIDHLRDAGVLPTERFKSGEFAWRDVRRAFFDGFHSSLRAYADAGNDLILEHILDTDGWLDDLRRLLSEHDVFFVAVHCLWTHWWRARNNVVTDRLAAPRRTLRPSIAESSTTLSSITRMAWTIT